MIGQTIGQLWDTVKVKFVQDSKGLWYNERLEQEQNKRKQFTDSRKNNLLGKNQHTKKRGRKTSDMEDVNENVSIDKDKSKDEKSLHSVLKEIFLEFYNKGGEYNYYWKAKDGKSMQGIIAQLRANCEEDKIPDAFRVLLEKNKDKWINDHLSVSIINSKFNEIVRKIKGSTDSRIEDIKNKFS